MRTGIATETIGIKSLSVETLGIQRRGGEMCVRELLMGGMHWAAYRW